MSANDDWMPVMVDDPQPPEPDDAVLAHVVGRGRQRLVRRRAIFGAIAASVAVVLVGAGVSVAQRRDSARFAVKPGLTVPSGAITERSADANGLHFTFRLIEPEVTVSEKMEVALSVDNQTGAVVYVRSCDIAGVVISEPGSTWISKNNFCNPARFGLNPGNSYTWTPDAVAPDSPGRYSVTVQPAPEFALPKSLLQPLSLRVVAAASPTPADDPHIPHVGDFSGALRADRTTTAVGNGVNVDLNIRNITDHVVEPGIASTPNAVGFVCARDLTPDGHTTQLLQDNLNLLLVVTPELAPGESSGRSGTYTPTADDIGTVTCAGVVVTSEKVGQEILIRSLGRITNIPAVTFTVTPEGAP